MAPHYRSRVWLYGSESESQTLEDLDVSEVHHPTPFHSPRNRPLSSFLPSTSIVWKRNPAFKQLTGLPLDVLFEVFCHLQPVDLLNLARTTRRLRDLLMSRSSKYVWKTVLAKMPRLPPCPQDLSEPQYVNLLFDRHCHFCLAPNVELVFWVCRVRCCRKCMPYYFAQETILEEQAREFPAIRKDEQSFVSLFPYTVYPKPRRNKPGRIYYYMPAVEKYLGEVVEMEESGADLEVWCKEKRGLQAQRIMHAALCESWNVRWAFQRSQEWNLPVVIGLLLLLAFLWRDKLW